MSITPPINYQPLGLLDAFGVKNGGSYPRELLNTLQPSLELGDWYNYTNAEQLQLTTPVIGSGASVFIASATAVPGQMGYWTVSNPSQLPVGNPGIQVPQNEVWLLMSYCMTVQCNGTAGSIIHGLQMAIRPALASIVFTRLLPSTYISVPTSTANGNETYQCAMDVPQYALPGDRLGFFMGGWLSGGGVGTASASGCIAFRRIKI